MPMTPAEAAAYQRGLEAAALEAGRMADSLMTGETPVRLGAIAAATRDIAAAIRALPVPDAPAEPSNCCRGLAPVPECECMRADYVVLTHEQLDKRDKTIAQAAIDNHRQTEVDAIAYSIVCEVAELPDRTSPPDDPTMMQVTADELDSIVRAALRAARGQG